MNQLTIGEIARGTEGKLICGEPYHVAGKVIIDSREAEKNAVFFALLGENQDGHQYVPSAAEKGCGLLVVMTSWLQQQPQEAIDGLGCAVIAVEDTLLALQKLAAWYLDQTHMTRIAVTGSVGKTTTRDMIYAGLKKAFRTGVSPKNYNSLTGLPLAILSLAPDTEVAVLELGIDKPGQMVALARIARPDIAVITNVGVSHLEAMGTREALCKEKMDVTACFTETNTLIYNGEDDYLPTAAQGKPFAAVACGAGETCLYRVTRVEDRGAAGIGVDIVCPEGTFHQELPFPGAHNGGNACLALAACVVAGRKAKEALADMADTAMTGNRLRVFQENGYTVIDDSYNAAPASMCSAAVTLMHSEGKRHVAILGTMRELGADSDRMHAETGQFVAKQKPDLLIVIGEQARSMAEGARQTVEEQGLATQVLFFPQKEDLYPRLSDLLAPGDTILVKASRTLYFEELTAKILRKDGVS